MITLLLTAGLTLAQVSAQADTDYAALLRDTVVYHSDGVASEVDYAALKPRRDQLKQVLERLSAVSEDTYDEWTEAEQLAFLINAYNAYTLELILTAYPDLESIRELGSLFRSPWKKAFFDLLDEPRSLDDVEHGMIREWFAEPRIHAAVNCASCGCPALLDEPFAADRLEQQLDGAMRKFLADPTRNRWDPERETLFLSPLFDWYGGDFEDEAGSVWEYVQPYRAELGLPDDVVEEPQIRFTTYSWALNDVKNCQG